MKPALNAVLEPQKEKVCWLEIILEIVFANGGFVKHISTNVVNVLIIILEFIRVGNSHVLVINPLDQCSGPTVFLKSVSKL